MSKQLMRIVLPRLARRLQLQLERYRSGRLNDAQFTKKFEDLLQDQYSWLTDRGVPEVLAAIAIHAGVLVLSSEGLRCEAAEEGVPLEIMELRAVRAAAADVSDHYNIDANTATRIISNIVAKFIS